MSTIVIIVFFFNNLLSFLLLLLLLWRNSLLDWTTHVRIVASTIAYRNGANGENGSTSGETRPFSYIINFFNMYNIVHVCHCTEIKSIFRSDVLIGNVTQPLKYYKANTEENMHKNTKKYAAVGLFFSVDDDIVEEEDRR